VELVEKRNDDEESRHVCCASCKCQIGKVYFHGPPPTFIKYQINSAALNFVLKPFFDDPVAIQERKKDAYIKRSTQGVRNFIEESDIEKK
jgi:peptide-methionine (R)-S-oxide reductase